MLKSERLRYVRRKVVDQQDRSTRSVCFLDSCGISGSTDRGLVGLEECTEKTLQPALGGTAVPFIGVCLCLVLSTKVGRVSRINVLR